MITRRRKSGAGTNHMHSAIRLCARLILLLGLVAPLQADWMPLGRIDTESIQSLTYGLSAFCRSAGFPYTLTDLNQFTSRGLSLPNLAGIDARRPATMHLLVETDGSRASARIATLGIVELTDNGSTLFATLDAVYAHRTEQIWGFIFTERREGFAGSDQLAVSIRGDKAYFAEIPEIIIWALKAGRQIISMPATAGQLAITMVPAELTACLTATNATLYTMYNIPMLPTGQVARAFSRLPLLLQDTDILNLSLNANGYALNANLTLGFKPASALQTWVANMRPPDRWYNGLAPPRATLVMVAGQSSRNGWRERLGWTLDTQLPTLEDLVGDRLMGNAITYLSNTRSGDGLIFVSIAKIIDPAESRRRLTTRLTNMPLPSGLTIRRTSDRRYAGHDIQCFTLTNSTVTGTASTSPQTSSILTAMANLLAKVTVLEATVIGQDLAFVAGPSGSIEPIIEDLKSDKTPYMSLPDHCRRFSSDLPAEASSVTMWGPVAMLRQIITTLPGYKSEQLEQITLPGDGLIAWTNNKNNRYTASLRIAANEVDAFRNAITRGRPVIQELLMQMVMQQVLRQPITGHDRSDSPSQPSGTP